jgi:hypothetical protein
MLLRDQNPHPRDSRITFVDSTHTYYIDGSSDGYISSTTLVHSLFPAFDADAIITKMMNSKRWPASPYFGKSPEQIKDGWDRNRDKAASAGTAMHENIEMYYNQEPHETSSKEFSMFSNYVKDFDDLVPFRTEWEIFDDLAMVAGSVDMVYKDPVNPGCLIIADWKRSKEIKTSNRWQRGSDPLTRHLQDCNFVHYSLQLALYKNILENRYGQTVTGTFLVILHPNQHNYIKMDTLDMDSTVQAILDRRMGKTAGNSGTTPSPPGADPKFEFSEGCVKDLCRCE